jgi:hypothetical protein
MIEGHDYCVWVNAKRTTESSDSLSAALNLDGMIDNTDFQMFKDNFLQGW